MLFASACAFTQYVRLNSVSFLMGESTCVSYFCVSLRFILADVDAAREGAAVTEIRLCNVLVLSMWVAWCLVSHNARGRVADEEAGAEARRRVNGGVGEWGRGEWGPRLRK